MTFLDRTGLAVTAASAEAVARLDATIEHFLAHARETPAALARTLEADPECALAWCAKGFFTLLLARGELRSAAADALARARASLRARGANARERAFVEALEFALARRMDAAADRLDAALVADPADSLAAKLVHALRFMLGDAAGMRASIDRVAARAGLDHPHIGYLLGCRAFALEETGAYAQAEAIGRKALSRAPRDAWGLHAVSHVHEMTGRAEEGAAFLESREGALAHCNNFAFHVFWHQALFRLDLGDAAGALELYDRRVRAERTDDFRDVANAASLLQRLELRGLDIGGRWEELAAIAEARVADRSLVFADLHYLLALLGAGRDAAALAMTIGFPLAYSGDQRRVAERAGAKVASALVSYRDGDFAGAAAGLSQVRGDLRLAGGSHAQRDIFEELMLDAMVRAGWREAARAHLARRLARRGRNRFARDLLERLAAPARAAGGLIEALRAPERE